jgi:hypothetical protein
MNPRNRECRGLKPSQSASISLALDPLHPVLIFWDDTRRNRHETAAPIPALVLLSRPVVRFDPLLWVYLAFFPHHSSSVSLPSAPVVEDSCPMTSDSRSYRGCLSSSSQNPRSIHHRPLLLLYSLSPAGTLPKLRSSKYRTALPHSSGSSHCRSRRNVVSDNPAAAGVVESVNRRFKELWKNRSLVFPQLRHFPQRFSPAAFALRC